MVKRKRVRRVRKRAKARPRYKRTSVIEAGVKRGLAGFLYGGFRVISAPYLAPAAAKLPFGQFSDEVVAFSVATLLTMTGNKHLASIGRAGQYVEAFSAGVQAGSKMTIGQSQTAINY